MEKVKDNSVNIKTDIAGSVDDDLTEIAAHFGLSKRALVRILINTGIKQIKYKAIKAGGFENLGMSLTQMVDKVEF